eukprot:Nk52_evm65s2192 gene=Nk52_evmTU65s2192
MTKEVEENPVEGASTITRGGVTVVELGAKDSRPAAVSCETNIEDDMEVLNLTNDAGELDNVIEEVESEDVAVVASKVRDGVGSADVEEKNGNNKEVEEKEDPTKEILDGKSLNESATSSSRKLSKKRSWWHYYEQLLKERTGMCQKTQDEVLEAKIKGLQNMKSEYSDILKCAQALNKSFQALVKSQTLMEDAFKRMVYKNEKKGEEEEEENKRDTEFGELFQKNANIMHDVRIRGQELGTIFQYFVDNIKTLCDKTIQDTLDTAKQLKVMRVSYDYDRDMLEKYKLALAPPAGAIEDWEKIHDESKTKFENLKCDVEVKLQLLHENRKAVLEKQLLLMQSALTAYSKGDDEGLKQAMTDFLHKA